MRDFQASFWCRRARALFAVLCLCGATLAYAADTFDGTYLHIPLVVVDGKTYSNVVITVGSVVGVAGGTPVASYDIYTDATGQLTIPSVLVGNTTYTNVQITVGKVISVGGTPTPIIYISAAYSAEFQAWCNLNCVPGDSIVSVVASDFIGQTKGQKQLLFNSIATAERVLPALAGTAQMPDILGYDFEHRPQTPADEQSDPLGSIKRGRVLANKYGIKLLFAPDRQYGQELAYTVGMYVDRWAFQLQNFTGDSFAIHGYADPIRLQLREVNHNIEISMQFRSDTTPQQIKAIVDSFSPQPNVVSELYLNYQSVVDLANVLR